MTNTTMASVFSLLLLTTGCGSSSSDSSSLITFETVTCSATAGNSSITSANTELISSPHRFVELYLASDLDSQDAEPTINFEEKSVIGIHLGQKPSSGYRVQVTRIEDKDSHLVVNYDVVSPSKNCNVDTALTYPYCFVAIAKNSKPVEYKARNIKRCGV